MPPFLANLMPWLVVLDAALIAGFVGALFYSAFMAAAGEDYSFLVGVSGELRPLFYIPVAVAVLTVLIVLGTIAGWTGHAWGWGRKLYRTALALAAVLALAVLVLWGLVGLPLAG